MKIYFSKETTPFKNLTLEEAMLKDEENNEDIIFLYQHDNAVIIGRNQNAFEEVKFDVLKEQNIELYRRISGGGAVYHDLGNINFSFITNKDERSYEKFLNPIIEFLKSLGLNAEFKGRNDLVVNGAKFSGNAQFIYKERMFHHGTILFNANLAKLSEVLNPSKLKMESKGIKSARQRVTNLIDELENKITVNEFIEKLIVFLKQKYNAEYLEIPQKYYQNANKIKEIRISEEWIYGKNPEFTIFNEAKTNGGILKIKIYVENSKIKNILFEGDFLSKKLIDDIIPFFLNKSYDKKEISNIFDTFNISDYFGSISKEEILNLFFGE